MPRIVFVLVLVLAAAVQRLPAQTRLDSARVRITAPMVSPGQIVGTVLGVEAGVLTLQEERAGRAVTSIPLNLVSFLEVSRGEIGQMNAVDRGMAKGLGVGALLGGLGGALWGLGTEGSNSSETPAARAALRGAVAGGVVGTLAGMVRGYYTRERWEEISLASVAFGPGGASLGVTVTR